MGKRRLVALLSMSSLCLVIVVCLFLTDLWVCLLFDTVVFPDLTNLLFLVVYTVGSLSLFCLLLIYLFVRTMGS